MCLGVASRKADKGESWLSSQNRNYHNRMGEGSFAYLASGATVAASSIEMKISDPRTYLAAVSQERFERILGRDAKRKLPEIRLAEPQPALAQSQKTTGKPAAAAAKSLSGRVQLFGDHIDTDAIIPGQFCHLTVLEELGAKCFHFVRPEFFDRAKTGQTIVVAGEGWGSGSSREQAVWALQGAGIVAVIAKSFAFIHKRNLVNEALCYLVVDDPAFYALVQENATVTIDGSSVAIAGKSFPTRSGTPMIRALLAEGGLVPAILHHGARVLEALAGET